VRPDVTGPTTNPDLALNIEENSRKEISVMLGNILLNNLLPILLRVNLRDNLF
jgi:hypothetical protein